MPHHRMSSQATRLIVPRVYSGTPIPDTLVTGSNVLIKGGVLISGVVLYTVLCSWDHGWCPD